MIEEIKSVIEGINSGAKKQDRDLEDEEELYDRKCPIEDCDGLVNKRSGLPPDCNECGYWITDLRRIVVYLRRNGVEIYQFMFVLDETLFPHFEGVELRNSSYSVFDADTVVISGRAEDLVDVEFFEFPSGREFEVVFADEELTQAIELNAFDSVE